MSKDNNNLNLAFVLGTKAQLIKSKYVLLELLKQNINLTIIDTGQHKEITKLELLDLNNQFNYVSFSDNSKNISSFFSMIFWLIKIVFAKKKTEELKKIRACLIHGDTLSTLLGLYVAKKHKIQVVHLESGLTSNNLFKPFPEEIVRKIVSRYSDVLVLDNKQSVSNTQKFSQKKKLIKITRNTVYDSIIYSALKAKATDEDLLIVTVHRTENIYSRKKLRNLVELLIDIKNQDIFKKITWYCHDITFNALKKHNFESLLIEHGIYLEGLLKHDLFVNKLLSCKAVLTDGGSIAEECSILGIKTVIWRDVVENKDYLSNKVILSKYDLNKIIDFFHNDTISSSKIDEIKKLQFESPSKDLVAKLISFYK